MEARTIVAIEIASSKIKGAACSIDDTGVPTVLAVEEIRSTNNVRHGRVQNVQAVSTDVNDIIRKLENNPAVMPRKVQAVFLPIGGRSMGGIQTSASIQFPTEREITRESIERLKQEAVKDVLSRKTIEAILPRVFYVNNIEVENPIGTFSKKLSGEFLLLACANENRLNLSRIKFNTIRPTSIHYIQRPLAIGNLVLSDDEKQLGCVLVDFGAETTTISIYKNGVLQFLSTLPLGSRLITRDITNRMNLTEQQAEEYKITYGTAIPENAGRYMPDKEEIVREVNNNVQSRSGEIVANIINQIIVSGFKEESLPKGIVVVGGGAMLQDFCDFLAAQSRMAVRKGSVPQDIHFKNNIDCSFYNIDIIAMLCAAARYDIDCLTHLPEEPVVKIGTTPDTNYTRFQTQQSNNVRNYDDIDEVHLLDDDPDTDETDEYDDNEQDLDEETDDTDTKERRGKKKSGFFDKIAGFFSNGYEDND